MKKTKLTRSLLAACSIVALSVVVYGCDSGPSQSEYDDLKAESDANADAAAAAAAAQAEAEAAAAAAAAEAADSAAAAAAAAQAQAEADAAVAAARQADAEADAAEAAARQAEAEAAQAEAETAKAEAEAAQAEAEAARAEAEAAQAEAEAAQAEAEAERDAAQVDEEEAEGEIADRDAKAASATAKALKAAIGSAPLAHLEPLSDGQPPADGSVAGQGSVPSITPSGLRLGRPSSNPDDRKDDTDLTANPPITGASRTPRMAAGDSAGMMGEWAGTHYSKTYPRRLDSHSAVAFRNRTDPIMTPFAAGATFGPTEANFEANYTRATRTLELNDSFTVADDGTVTVVANNPAPSFAIAGDMFPTAGTIEYTTADSAVQSVIIPGTYQGAEGDYYCTGSACSATATSSGIELSGDGGTADADWHFVHDEGASVTHMDPNYLFFGWWLHKDATGSPNLASAFTGVSGTIAVSGALSLAAGTANAVTGSATYAGHAAGKFAIDNPIGADDAGHFTADAELTATFGPNPAVNTPNNGGVSGTLDNFMANEEAVDWEVTLMEVGWSATDSAADDTATPGLTGNGMTRWHIGDGSADASGSWSAQFYDETSGAADDGDNVPTSATGTFHSEFGEFISMVGAFGVARMEDE